MPELLILRHAKSDWSTGEADFDRPLNPRGQRDAPRMGNWLKSQGLTPNLVLSSPARRARETTLAVVQALALDEEAIRWEAGIYEAHPGALMTVLRRCPAGTGRVLMVGHNPGLEQLLLRLCPRLSIPADGKLLPTATVAHLQLSLDWPELEPGSGELHTLMRPRELPER